jgi:xanthine dehydrogenase YagR molybdenum-binding subunit
MTAETTAGMKLVTGQALNRTDGVAKVTGTARFSAEHPAPRMAYAVLVQSTVPKGKISAIDTVQAAAMRGVLLVMTHQNAPRLPQPKPPGKDEQPPNPKLSLLQSDEVLYNGQPIAVVVADTLEQAQDAARRVRVRYARQAAALDFQAAKQHARTPKSQPERPSDTARGDADAALAGAAVRIDTVYTTPMENHNPMEPHATIAAWNGGHLTLYDATQNVSGVRKAVARNLGIAPDQVRVICL